MFRFLTSLLLLFIFSLRLDGQVFEGSTGPIRDDGVHTDFIAEVTGLTPDSLTPEHGLKSVCFTMTHTWVADLDVRLISPSGQTIMLTSGLGGDTDFYTNTCFRMDAVNHIMFAWSPFEGNWKPFSNIGNMNDGQVGNGQWTLRVIDTYAYADAGEVLN